MNPQFQQPKGVVSVGINIFLSMAATEDVSVSWATKDDTALSGIDYKEANGVTKFSPGETSKSISVEIMPRETSNARRFFVIVSYPVNAVISRGSAECKIIPVVINGPLIKSSLITNAYNNQLGRGGYFHSNSGTSEGQSVAIEGS